MKRKLTELTTRRLTEQGEYWDLVLPSFGLRVGKRAKAWQVAIRRPGEKHPTRVKLGTYPEMGLVEAREKARALMEGGAPAAPVSLGALVDVFLEHGRTKKGRELRRNTVDQYRRNLARYAAPLHRCPIREIKRRDIAGLLAGIARDSGAPTAALVRAMLARLFSWAIEVGHLDSNPASGVPGYSVGKRTRVLSEFEIRQLWLATEEPSDYHLIVRICLWCGARRGEASGVRWSELSRSGRSTVVWRLPGSRTKNGRQLELPISRQMTRAIAAWPRFMGRDLLFGVGPNGFTNWCRGQENLDRVLRFNEAWALHDLRRTCQTRMAGLRIPSEVINRLLNHAVGPVTEAYDRYSYFDEKAQALQTWADTIDEIVGTGQGVN